ncbi:amino acid ABC transporter substrate-binding protein [[Clostridium] hylemonae]|uniref:ABC transporter, substrate-binding protein, family 3 n=1 Tax=[Clostridium] hylemonae DSM 15053 TaxID=553973 RepID=C0C356_9FIRM|nr:amino acid ABC transporter substrate-binding protein [[Clostridium] hylemonae]EEG73406.1 ABC transporter, substrate-binding protein, family 3 [[Clostridium] hylemonae DSM 15053]QEK17323.1 L-cystine-binding protein TcyA [[Clostridium] hylemonae DSM 15053]BDF04331.1 amino acid ABC transporter substrate-binding protein [[Clostridium] hylemonae]
MKRKLAVLLVLVMVAGMTAAGCGNKEDKKADAKTDSKEEKADNDDGTFVVGFDAAFPPYGYKDDNGEYVGFDLDLAQEVCDRNGWKLKKQPIDWDSKDMELSSGTIDCIWNGFTMNGREDKYTWSDPYVDNSQVIVVPEDSDIKEFKDLAGKMVEVQADSSALHTLESDDKEEGGQAELAATFGALNQVADYNTAFMDLESGACEAIAMDVGVANYQIDSRGGGFRLLDEKLSTEQYGIGFKKGNEELRDTVQKTLNEMAEDGTLDKIVEKWADGGISADAVCLGKQAE